MNDKMWLPPNALDRQAQGSTPVGVFVPADRVFPGIQPTAGELKKLLTRLSRTDSLIWCARLNLIVSNATHQDHLVKQRFAINTIFSPEEIERIAAFLAGRKEPQQTAVFFRAQLLELIQWLAVHCCDLPGDGSTFEDPGIRQTFGKAALIAGELWGSRSYASVTLSASIQETRKRCLGAMRVGLDAASTGMDPVLAIARGRQMFLGHLRHFRPSVSQEFHEASGLPLETFYALTMIIAIYYLVRAPDQGGPREAASGLFGESHFAEVNRELGCAFRSYADFAAQTPEDLAGALRELIRDGQPLGSSRGLARIRERPILRMKDGRCIVMDPTFFGEHAAVGPLFAIVRKKTAKKEQDQCFVDFGEAFERYSQSVLQRMYPAPAAPMVARVAFPVAGISREGTEVEIADACLNNVTDVVLIEMKARWLPDECAEADGPSRYVSALRDRYARPEGPRVRPKGAGQLANSIAHLANGEWKPKVQDFTSARTIYPVLLCYDPGLQAPGHTWYLAEEFRVALAPDDGYADGDMRKGRFRVSGLIVLSIDDLEALEASIENFCLADLLRDYSRASPDRMSDIRTFLATSEYRKRLFASRGWAEAALAAIRDAEDLMNIPRERRE
jgi:hypothetical protein